MNFNDVKLAAKVVMRSGRVPMIQGERGIGKSSMARAIAKEEGMLYINIDMNLCKEGELGGLPISEDRVSKSGKVLGKKTSYAPYHKLLQALTACSKGKEVLLFLDELNRCEPAVIQEAMNLILNREINGLQLPENCYLMGAMNPPGSSSTGDTNYQVTEMDAAAIDRFVWLELDSDLKNWLDWAASSINTEAAEDELVINIKENKRKQNIHPKAIEFLVQHPDMLNVEPTETNPITPSPRSWEMLSDTMYTYEANKKFISEKIFYEICKGCVGSAVAGDFIRAMKDNSNPLLTAEEFFKTKDEDKIITIVTNENPTRQFLLFKNVLNYLIDNKATTKMYERLIVGIKCLPADMMVSVMKSIKANYGKVHKACSNNDDYLDLFMKMVEFVK